MAKVTLEDLAQQASSASLRVKPESQRELKLLALEAKAIYQDEIRRFKAVVTGNMLNSVDYWPKGPSDQYLIGPTAWYSRNVALGIDRKRAKPFHRTSADKLASHLESLQPKIWEG